MNAEWYLKKEEHIIHTSLLFDGRKNLVSIYLDIYWQVLSCKFERKKMNESCEDNKAKEKAGKVEKYLFAF